MKSVLIIIIIVLVIAAGAWYYTSQDSDVNENANTNINANANANTNQTVNVNPAKESDAHTFFQDAVNTNDHSSMEASFADTVNFIIEGSECCGDVTASNAATEMKYFDEVTSFNFSQDQQIVKQIKTNLVDFSDETVGIADGKQVISYHLDANNKIDRVYLSASHQLMDLE